MVCGPVLQCKPPEILMISLIGPPGAGKGAFSRHLIDSTTSEIEYEHISVGDLIRDQIAARSAIGVEVKDIVERGGLVDDPIVMRLIEAKLQNITSQSNQSQIVCDPKTGRSPVHTIILDGFPRRLSQSTLLDSVCTYLHGAVHPRVSNLTSLHRLSS
jgi:adenylate kinase